ncbi:WbuC family cupin fold metalloprotein [Tardiphaga sp. 619_E2_N8_5]|uniref:WbuC family cupin fold metalloprotein n=1 Tax=unclassified Tardiphaga TaxID=2631404 RepID=UPI003F23DDAD
MALVQKSPEVFSTEGSIATVGAADIETLRNAVVKTSKRRARINAHPGSDDNLHEMIIAIEPGSYIRPHKHPGKSEAFHIIEGAVDIVVFDDAGEIDQIVSLAAKGGEAPFYYRMSKPHYHTLIIRSELLVVHEITNGPFRPEGTVFATFAPEEGDLEAVNAFQAMLVDRVASFQSAVR